MPSDPSYYYHVVLEIQETIVNRLRWSSYNAGSFSVFSDRDVNFDPDLHLPCVDVRIGNEVSIPGRLNSHTAEIEFHVDHYAQSAGRAYIYLMGMRWRTYLALMSPAAAQKFYMEPRVQFVGAVSAEEIKVGDGSAQAQVGVLRTTYKVRYSVDRDTVNEPQPPNVLATATLIGSSPFSIAAGGASWSVQAPAATVYPQLAMVVGLTSSASAPSAQMVFDGTLIGPGGFQAVIPALQTGGSIDASSFNSATAGKITTPGSYTVWCAACTAGRISSTVGSVPFVLTA